MSWTFSRHLFITWPPVNPWGSQGVADGYQKSGLLQLLLEHLFGSLLAGGCSSFEGLGACCVVTVLQHVCPGSAPQLCHGGGAGRSGRGGGGVVFRACVVRASGMRDFLTSMLCGMYVGQSIYLDSKSNLRWWSL